MTTICKVWKAGSNLKVITVPVNEAIVENIEIGDLVEVTFKKVGRKENTVKSNSLTPKIKLKEENQNE